MDRHHSREEDLAMMRGGEEKQWLIGGAKGGMRQLQ